MQSEDLLPELKRVRTILESHYRDMCDFEFTVQQGRLYVLSVRPGKRSSEAAIRIACDLFIERRITGSELLSRVSPRHVQDALRPAIIPTEGVRVIGMGIGASTGIATGIVALSTEAALRVKQQAKTPLLLRSECTPDDIPGLDASCGVVSFRGASRGTRQ